MSDTIDIAAASLIEAHERRFALAGEVGRMRGAIRLALAALDCAVDHPSLAVEEAREAARILRMAMEMETDRSHPRAPDPGREGIFRDHNCARCKSGEMACVRGNPRQCEWPHARND